MNFWTYITTNKYNRVLYTGVTGDIKSRIENHKNKKYPNAFTARYNADKLVWYQEFDNIKDAYKKEKQIKSGSRQNKMNLINELNPEWKDLMQILRGE